MILTTKQKRALIAFDEGDIVTLHTPQTGFIIRIRSTYEAITATAKALEYRELITLQVLGIRQGMAFSLTDEGDKVIAELDGVI